MEIIHSVGWSADGRAVRIIDQRVLPDAEVYCDLRTLTEVCDAIMTLAVRGAPAIGIAGAMGLVVGVESKGTGSRETLLHDLVAAADRIRGTRPTAVNLPAALDRMLARARATEGSAADVTEALRREASAILAEDRAMCRRIGEYGAALLQGKSAVLTHCNTGALATGGIGTAIAAVYVAAERGQRMQVFACETRPLLQGARLTAWELTRAGIPVTVLVDGAAATLMREGRVDACLVGADRIARNGDVANKVGTYALALAARAHDVPFYVAAPSTTFDALTPWGKDIVIEQRPPEEVFTAAGARIAPKEATVYNPAFDVTPGELVTAIVSDTGVHHPPYRFG